MTAGAHDRSIRALALARGTRRAESAGWPTSIGFDHVERLLELAAEAARRRVPSACPGSTRCASGQVDRARGRRAAAAATPARRRTLSRFRCLFLVRSSSAPQGWADSAERSARGGRASERVGRRAGAEVVVAAGAADAAAGSPKPAAGRPVPAARGPGARGSCRTSWWIAKSRGRPGFAAARGRRAGPDRVGRGAVGGRGFSGHGPLTRRDTLESQGV